MKASAPKGQEHSGKNRKRQQAMAVPQQHREQHGQKRQPQTQQDDRDGAIEKQLPQTKDFFAGFNANQFKPDRYEFDQAACQAAQGNRQSLRSFRAAHG